LSDGPNLEELGYSVPASLDVVAMNIAGLLDAGFRRRPHPVSG
jgi:hypothetical protein